MFLPDRMNAPVRFLQLFCGAPGLAFPSPFFYLCRMTTELCAYSIEACETARRAGVARAELCASPYEGGTTPSAAAIRAARRIGGLQLSVMIRPRGGDFLYDDAEFRQMLEEVRLSLIHI